MRDLSRSPRACPCAHAASYGEMTAHRVLMPDHNVQQTQFANGMTVTVNFGDASYFIPDGTIVADAAK